MAQITTLVTGAGVTTIVAGQSQCEAVITVGTVGTANPLQGLQVEIDGIPFININNSATLITAWSKYMMNTINGTGIIGIRLPIATGRIYKTTTYRFVNNGATTPAIYAFSDNQVGIPFLVGTKQINATSYEDFQKFTALMIGTPANVASAEFTFQNGTKSTLATQEIDTLFSSKYQVEASGQLGGISVIDNRDPVNSKHST